MEASCSLICHSLGLPCKERKRIHLFTTFLFTGFITSNFVANYLYLRISCRRYVLYMHAHASSCVRRTVNKIHFRRKLDHEMCIHVGLFNMCCVTTRGLLVGAIIHNLISQIGVLYVHVYFRTGLSLGKMSTIKGIVALYKY